MLKSLQRRVLNRVINSQSHVSLNKMTFFGYSTAANIMYDDLIRNINQKKEELLSHKVYSLLNNHTNLQIFMQSHVFQVWDFMLLVKSMQYILQNNNFLPWIPPKNELNEALYFVTEIVLGEETDTNDEIIKLTGKKTLSHCEMYLKAMKQIGSDSAFFEHILHRLENEFNNVIPMVNSSSKNEYLTCNFNFSQMCADTLNNDKDNKFENCKPNMSCIKYSDWIFNLCIESILNNNSKTNDELHKIVAAFLLGRENIIPPMFEKVQQFLQKDESNSIFWLYLDRHIELDGHGDSEKGIDSHQVLGGNLLKNLCGENENKWNEALDIGIKSLDFRCLVWNDVVNQINSKQTKVY